MNIEEINVNKFIWKSPVIKPIESKEKQSPGSSGKKKQKMIKSNTWRDLDSLVEEFMSENIFSSIEKSPDHKPVFKKTKEIDYNLTIQRVQREPEER